VLRARATRTIQVTSGETSAAHCPDSNHEHSSTSCGRAQYSPRLSSVSLVNFHMFTHDQPRPFHALLTSSALEHKLSRVFSPSRKPRVSGISRTSQTLIILSRKEAHKTKRAPGGPTRWSRSKKRQILGPTRCQTNKRQISIWHLGQGNPRCPHRS
jgi:hypothetical protein